MRNNSRSEELSSNLDKYEHKIRKFHKQEQSDSSTENEHASSQSMLCTPSNYKLHTTDSVSCIYNPLSGSKYELTTKNYLVGSIAGGSGSLLGLRELTKTFPKGSVEVQVVSWNMAAVKPHQYPDDLTLLFSNTHSQEVASLYAICVQECSSDKNELLIRLQSAVGIKHVLYSTATNGSLLLAIFINRDLIWYTSVAQSIGITTTASVRTKGVVAICFIIFGTSILFISAHFKGQSSFRRRVQDYFEVLENLNLPKVGLAKGYRHSELNPIDRFDAVFWAGDLNFRIQKPRHVIENIIYGINRVKNYEDLLSADELINAQADGTIFEKFDEGRIRFPPTYKFDVNTDEYDSSEKKRIPSYTDRILFTCKNKGDIICLEYDSIKEIRSSDHRPVYGLFNLILKPGCDNIALAAGAFNRDIYIAGNQRRATRFDSFKMKKTKSRSIVCVII